jgi:hypothetical protein
VHCTPSQSQVSEVGGQGSRGSSREGTARFQGCGTASKHPPCMVPDALVKPLQAIGAVTLLAQPLLSLLRSVVQGWAVELLVLSGGASVTG